MYTPPFPQYFFPKRAEEEDDDDDDDDDDDEIFLQKSQDSSNLLGKLGLLTILAPRIVSR